MSEDRLQTMMLENQQKWEEKFSLKDALDEVLDAIDVSDPYNEISMLFQQFQSAMATMRYYSHKLFSGDIDPDIYFEESWLCKKKARTIYFHAKNGKFENSKEIMEKFKELQIYYGFELVPADEMSN